MIKSISLVISERFLHFAFNMQILLSSHTVRPEEESEEESKENGKKEKI